ncbi:MAG: hypothetical protein J6C17_04435 [Clostridia bacterium]|nr:hypothetical protein [Clostridia bacterium]
MKRIFCFLFVIILCFCSVSVFAEEIEDNSVSLDESVVDIIQEEQIDDTNNSLDLESKIDYLNETLTKIYIYVFLYFYIFLTFKFFELYYRLFDRIV